jgi:cold shock CspA family protein
MAKSRETYNKKEKEKKKLQKKQNKEEKKEARKSNSGKGTSFEDMLAYVDENGNITSTPPDPSKKKKIDQESISIGIPRQENLPEDTINEGTVTFFNESKGYGFIKDSRTQESIFVHKQGLIDDIKEKDKVTYEIEKSPKGPRAIDVKRIK